MEVYFSEQRIKNEMPTPKSAQAVKNSVAKTPIPATFHACVLCKTSKQRCEGVRPCGRCVRVGKGDCCVDSEHQKRGRKRNPNSANAIRLARLQKRDSDVETNSTCGGPSAPPSVHSISPEGTSRSLPSSVDPSADTDAFVDAAFNAANPLFPHARSTLLAAALVTPTIAGVLREMDAIPQGQATLAPFIERLKPMMRAHLTKQTPHVHSMVEPPSPGLVPPTKKQKMEMKMETHLSSVPSTADFQSANVTVKLEPIEPPFVGGFAPTAYPAAMSSNNSAAPLVRRSSLPSVSSSTSSAQAQARMAMHVIEAAVADTDATCASLEAMRQQRRRLQAARNMSVTWPMRKLPLAIDVHATQLPIKSGLHLSPSAASIHTLSPHVKDEFACDVNVTAGWSIAKTMPTGAAADIRDDLIPNMTPQPSESAYEAIRDATVASSTIEDEDSERPVDLNRITSAERFAVAVTSDYCTDPEDEDTRASVAVEADDKGNTALRLDPDAAPRLEYTAGQSSNSASPATTVSLESVSQQCILLRRAQIDVATPEESGAAAAAAAADKKMFVSSDDFLTGRASPADHRFASLHMSTGHEWMHNEYVVDADRALLAFGASLDLQERGNKMDLACR